MIYIIAILLLGGFVLAFLGLVPNEADIISVYSDAIKKKQGSVFSSILSPFAPFNRMILKFLKTGPALDNKLTLVKWQIEPAEFLSVKQLVTIITVLMFIFVFEVKKGVIISVAALAGFIVPNLVLNSKVKARKYSIVRVLPETVDLLALCVGAGLDFMAAVRWIIEKVKPTPLIEELTMVLKEINVGKPRLEALRDMSKRLNIPDVTSFVRALIQADRMGTPVEETFRILSEDSRMRRFHRGERQAMKAPIKMLLPLIFFILPVIMIIVAGPIVIKFITGGLFTLE